MLDTDQLSRSLREHGQAESDRLLQALTHLLLLNLRAPDVLCRFGLTLTSDFSGNELRL